MSIIRIGSNKKFADGWQAAFEGKKKKRAATKTAKKAASAKKSAGKKKATGKKKKK